MQNIPLDKYHERLFDCADMLLRFGSQQAILLLPLVLLALLRNFKYLAWTSAVGDFAVVCGAITVMA